MNSDLPRANRARAVDAAQPYRHSGLTGRMVAGFYATDDELGYGFLESVYEAALVRFLCANGLAVEQQVEVPVDFRGAKIGQFQTGLILNSAAILERKAVLGARFIAGGSMTERFEGDANRRWTRAALRA